MTLEEIKAKYPLALSSIELPVRYDDFGQMIFDADNNLILDIRGWGHFQYKEEGIKCQDELGSMVADLINTMQDEK